MDEGRVDEMRPDSGLAVDGDHHVPGRMAILVHQLVRLAGRFEREHFREAGLNPSLADQTIERAALLGVGEMRSLEPLLPHPVIAQIERAGVSGRAGADHYHAACLDDEYRRRQRVLPWVLDD